MKLNRIILVSILLAILTLGAVSASQDVNMTAGNNLAVENDNLVAADATDEIIGNQNEDIAAESNETLSGAANAAPIEIEGSTNDGQDSSLSMNAADDDILKEFFIPDELSGYLYGHNYRIVGKDPVHLIVRDDYVYNHGDEMVLHIDSKADFEIFIDGKKYTDYRARTYMGAGSYDLYDGFYNIEVLQDPGSHKIVVSYKGNKDYDAFKVSSTFNVAAVMDYDGSYVYGNDKGKVSLKLPKNAKGNLVVKIDGKAYKTAKLSNGNAAVSFSKLSLGEHEISAYYDGSDYKVVKFSKAFNVTAKIQAYKNSALIDYLYHADFRYAKGSLYFSLKLPADANGTLQVSVDGTVYKKKLVNGTAKIKMPILDVGNHRVVCKYVSDDGYNVDDFYDSFTVKPALLPLPKMTLFAKNTVSFNASKNFNGKIRIEVDDYYGDNKVYEAKFKNGKASISLSGVTSGTHVLKVSCYAGDEVWDMGIVKVTVAHGKNPKVIVAPKCIYYMKGTFKAKVLNVNGQPVKNANVIFKVNGMKKATVKTNALGIAVFKMTNVPDVYRLTAQYGKIILNKKVAVIQILRLKQIEVKKSAKSLTLMASLKCGKIPLKNQLIVFRFNGKIFKAKTNNIGVARVVINNALLSKLTVGRVITYEATYIRDTVSYRASVEK